MDSAHGYGVGTWEGGHLWEEGAAVELAGTS